MIPASLERTSTFRSAFDRPAPLDSETRHPARQLEDWRDAVTRVFMRTGGFACGDDITRLLRRHHHQPLSLLALDSVDAFAGENYETPVISEKARGLLVHHEGVCAHLELAGRSHEARFWRGESP